MATANSGQASAETLTISRASFESVYQAWLAELSDASPDGLPVADASSDWLFQALRRQRQASEQA